MGAKVRGVALEFDVAIILNLIGGENGAERAGVGKRSLRDGRRELGVAAGIATAAADG